MTSPARGSAYLLTQLGTMAARRFAERVEELGLTPPLAGVLRLLAASPGLSQRALAERLGSAPSRVVGFVDELESRDLVERRRSATDRRNHELHLTAPGQGMLRRIAKVGRAHEEDFLSGLDEPDRDALHRLLLLLADERGVDPLVHPGYRG